MAHLLENREAVVEGLTVMGHDIFVRLLPERLEKLLGWREASIIIYGVAEEGARRGFQAFLEKTGASIGECEAVSIFVRRDGMMHPFQVFEEAHRTDKGWLLVFDRETSALVKRHPSVAAVFAGVIAGCLGAIGSRARFITADSAAGQLCRTGSPPRYVIRLGNHEDRPALLLEELQCPG